MSGGRPRFDVHVEGDVVYVVDREGPRFYFTDSREAASVAASLANEIAERNPAALTMSHLHEMDAAWRRERGLPPLPEPVAHLPAGGAPSAPRGLDEPAVASVPSGMEGSDADRGPKSPAPTGSIETTLDLAARAAARRGLRDRVDAARAALARTEALADEVTRFVGAEDAFLPAFRTALQSLYGEHASAAEIGFRRACVDHSPGHAVSLLRRDPRALLPPPRPPFLVAGTHRRDAAAEHGAPFAVNLARSYAVLVRACAHLGLEAPAPDADLGVVGSTVGERLGERTRTERTAALEAVAEARRMATTSASAASLRREWAALSAAEREAVRLARPDIEALMTRPPDRARKGSRSLDW